MWTGLPDLNALLTPVLTWATAAVATIAAIILVWSIYENWTQNPDRFSWFAALFKALGVGLDGWSWRELRYLNGRKYMIFQLVRKVAIEEFRPRSSADVLQKYRASKGH